MLVIILFYLAVSLVSAIILFFFIKSAPEGYEDEMGFHEIKNRKIK